MLTYVYCTPHQKNCKKMSLCVCVCLCLCDDASWIAKSVLCIAQTCVVKRDSFHIDIDMHMKYSMDIFLSNYRKGDVDRQ